MRSLRPSVFAILVLSFPLMGCQKIFTTSLAEGLARDNYTISANISNDAAANIIDDPNTSSAVLSNLLAVLNDQATTGDSGAAALAAEAAVGASGVTTSLMPVLTELAHTKTPPDAASTATILSTLATGASPEVVEGLLRLSDPATLAAANLEPTDLVFAAALLAASALPDGVSNPADLSGTDLDNYRTSPAVQLAITLAGDASAGLAGTTLGSELADSITDLLNTGA